MNNIIEITIRNKVARIASSPIIVGKNKDYIVRFDFDEDWDKYDTKTARFSQDEQYQDIIFAGNECSMPALDGGKVVEVGVYAGDISTTTPAYLKVHKSIIDDDGVPADPTPDVYAQLMERFNAMEPPAAVLYTAQELTDEQKATARENIGVATPLTVNLTMDNSGNITADKTFAEIKAAYDDGKVVDAKFKGTIVPLGRLTDSEAIFTLTNANSSEVRTASLTCTSDNVWSMSQDGFRITDGYSLGLAGATVGQTVKIKAVDENGAPTEWEAGDLPSGEVKLIASCTLEETASAIEFTGLNTKNKSISIRIKNTGNSCGNGWQIWVNGVKQDGNVGGPQSTSTYYAQNRIWLFPDGSTLRGISQCANGGTNHYNWTNFQGTITSIKLTSSYHSDTSKYYGIGTNVEVYEGILPNIQ